MTVKRMNSRDPVYLCWLYLICAEAENKELALFPQILANWHQERDSSWQPLEN
jgi:hypothetical protein